MTRPTTASPATNRPTTASPATNQTPGDRAVPDVHEMIVVHRVFRREFPLLARLIREVPDGDVRRARQVGGHVQLLLTGLHMHHSGEDAVLWPRLLERAAPSADLIRTMEVQHARVDRQIGRLEPAVTEWMSTGSGGPDLAGLLDELAEALFEHLDLEERAILPLVSEHVTVAEWASLGEHGRGEMSTRQLPLLFGAVLEEVDPTERAGMLRALPLPVRVLLRTVGAWHYRRYITRVRGA